jgi:hypothetical protein
MIKSLSRNSSSKNGKRRSKAVTDQLNNDDDGDAFEVWASSSMTSVASSVTAPPSQTASFYKRVMYGGFDHSDSSESISDHDNTTSRGSDDDLSFAESRSSSDGGSLDLDDSNSEGAVNSVNKQTRRKKLKKKKSKLLRHKIFGGATIKEGDDEEEDDAVVSTKQRRRLSLFGNSKHGATTAEEVSAELTVSDDGCGHSQDGSQDASLGYGDGAPTVQNRRGSMGGDGKTTRRSSLGGMFAKKPNRRASMTSAVDSKPDEGDNDKKAQRRQRRNSLLGPASSEHISRTHQMDESMGRRGSLDAKSLHSTRRKSSLSTSSKHTSSNTNIVPRDIHWLINQERRARKMYLLERCLVLDALAKSMAQEMMNGHAPSPSDYYGNVGKGESLDGIHQTIMQDVKGQSRKNILSQDFHEFGAAVCQAKKGGLLVMVALFKS